MKAYTYKYYSPLGPITIAADEEAITGLWFDGQRYFGCSLPQTYEEKQDSTLFKEAAEWLDIYFSGQEPDFLPPMKYGATPFRKGVCDIMLEIPYGKTMSYGEIAARIAKEKGLSKMPCQAVGGAVGHNPISIMIPCHRVVGTNGSLTGYAGGIDRKVKLLALEKIDMTKFFIPKKAGKL